MALEIRNVGFNVYRMTDSGPQMVNRNIIGGFATRTSVPTGYGERYELYDPDGALGSVYFIQSLATDGRRVSTCRLRYEVYGQF